MRIVKLNHKTTTGQLRKSPRWHVEFTDHHAVRRRVVAFTDKQASDEFGRTIERLVSMRATGMPLDKAMSAWLELLSDRHRARFAEWGLIDAQVSSLSDPLTVHVESFRQHLEAKGRTAGYVRDKCSRVLAVMTGAGFAYFRDIRAEAIRTWGATKRDDGMSKRTWAHHVDAIRAFCTFMAASGRVASSPLENLKALDVDDEKPRGVMTRKQLDKLCAATPARALLYWTAFETTQRRSTLATLTRGDLRVQRGNCDTVSQLHAPITGGALRTVQRKGRAAKAREHYVPLKAALAAALDDHASRMTRNAPLFRIPQKSAALLRADLLAAGLPTVDTEGNLIDFHSLRHSGLTWWAENGADIQTLKQLSGHKSSRMLDRYTDHRDADAALKRLGDIEAPSPLRMTGTDGAMGTNCSQSPAARRAQLEHPEPNPCAPAAQMEAEPVRPSPRDAASRYDEGRTGGRAAEGTGLLNRRRGLPLPRVRIPPCPLF